MVFFLDNVMDHQPCMLCVNAMTRYVKNPRIVEMSVSWRFHDLCCVNATTCLMKKFPWQTMDFYMLIPHDAICVHACKSEVINEQYHTKGNIGCFAERRATTKVNSMIKSYFIANLRATLLLRKWGQQMVNICKKLSHLSV